MSFNHIDWLIIAEKKTQAEAICQAIFDKGTPQGTFENGGRGGDNISSLFKGTVVVTRFQGHLYQLLYPDEQDKKYVRKQEAEVNDWGLNISSGGWKSAEEMLNVYPVQLDVKNEQFKFKPSGAKQKALANNLKTLYKKADRVILSTDVDPEGELIFLNWLKNAEGSYNAFDPKKMYRVNPVNNDPVSIRNMFQTSLQNYDQLTGELGEVYQSLGPRGYARFIADYEYGLTYTLIGELIQEKISPENGSIIYGAWGRLKNTILGHVYQRELAYDTFKPSSSYRVDMVLSTGAVLKGDKRLIFDTKEEAQAFLSQGKLPKEVRPQITYKDKKTKPPKLFSRAELLKAVSKHGGSEDLGKVLQKLYETYGLLSYPRTESQHIGEDEYLKLKKYIEQETIKDLLTKRVRDITKNNSLELSFYDRPIDKTWVDDQKITPHFALIPNLEKEGVSHQLIQKLSDTERVMFLEDLYHTAALYFNDVHKKVYTVQAVKDKEGKYLFTGQFNTVIDQGWKMLIGPLEESDTIPKDGQYQVTYNITEIPKKRPQLLGVYDLVEVLKKHNQGTSATRDQTINSMVNSKVLIYDKKDKLRVNPKLKPSVAFLLEKTWIDMEKTTIWDEMLKEVKTKEDALRFITQIRHDTQMLLDDIRRHFHISK